VRGRNGRLVAYAHVGKIVANEALLRCGAVRMLTIEPNDASPSVVSARSVPIVLGDSAP
jgi:hypothetical protein